MSFSISFTKGGRNALKFGVSKEQESAEYEYNWQRELSEVVWFSLW
jgi:hypothetical protein